MTRDNLRTAFVANAGWAAAQMSHLAGDASNRTYFRLVADDGRQVVLMDAPPEKGEDIQPFVKIAQYLTAHGLSAPEVFHIDDTAGFLLIEDLGDRLFAREMVSDPTVQMPLYRAAADVLSHLHATPPPALDTYGSEITVPLAALAYDWYLSGATGCANETARNLFSKSFLSIIAPYDTALDVMIQRDYHAENLLWLPDRHGIRRVGLLDFQGAVLGHVAYDLMSVLQDARRDVPPEIAEAVKTYFIAENNHLSDDFEAAYAVFGLQRNLRILGVFARLCLRDGKASYVDLMPRVWGHVQTNLRHPILADIAPMILRDLPAPTPDVCARLKEKSGRWSNR